MKVWVIWTHFDCQVSIALYATQDECYQDLKGWLDDCSEDDCGHVLEDMDNRGIIEAIEYHLEELEYSIDEWEVPQPPLTAERVVRPTEQNAMPLERADALLSSLQSFRESS